VNQIQVEPGGTLGGLFADTAVANGVVYANGINWPGGNPGAGVPPVGGDLIAISGDGSKELWRFPTPRAYSGLYQIQSISILAGKSLASGAGSQSG